MYTLLKTGSDPFCHIIICNCISLMICTLFRIARPLPTHPFRWHVQWKSCNGRGIEWSLLIFKSARKISSFARIFRKHFTSARFLELAYSDSRSYVLYCWYFRESKSDRFKPASWCVFDARLESFNPPSTTTHWTLLSPARVQSLYGAGRKESSGTGLRFA